jgi:hypothetical protein
VGGWRSPTSSPRGSCHWRSPATLTCGPPASAAPRLGRTTGGARAGGIDDHRAARRAAVPISSRPRPAAPAPTTAYAPSPSPPNGRNRHPRRRIEPVPTAEVPPSCCRRHRLHPRLGDQIIPIARRIETCISDLPPTSDGRESLESVAGSCVRQHRSCISAVPDSAAWGSAQATTWRRVGVQPHERVAFRLRRATLGDC